MRPFVWVSHIHKTLLQIRASSLFYLMRLLYHYHKLFIDIKRENVLCVIDRVSFIELLAMIRASHLFYLMRLLFIGIERENICHGKVR